MTFAKSLRWQTNQQGAALAPLVALLGAALLLVGGSLRVVYTIEGPWRYTSSRECSCHPDSRIGAAGSSALEAQASCGGGVARRPAAPSDPSRWTLDTFTLPSHPLSEFLTHKSSGSCVGYRW